MSTKDHGLKFAFALTAYDNKTDYVDESEYGEIYAQQVTWGIQNHFIEEFEIPIRHCTSEELGIADGQD